MGLEDTRAREIASQKYTKIRRIIDARIKNSLLTTVPIGAVYSKRGTCNAFTILTYYWGSSGGITYVFGMVTCD